jgi:hypothetical protein
MPSFDAQLVRQDVLGDGHCMSAPPVEDHLQAGGIAKSGAVGVLGARAPRARWVIEAVERQAPASASCMTAAMSGRAIPRRPDRASRMKAGGNAKLSGVS